MKASEIRDAIESCRPRSDDLSLPEMVGLSETLSAEPALRATFDRIQRFDQKIAAATCDVPVPGGLAERVLARLPVQEASADPSHSEREAPDVAMPAVETAVGLAATLQAAADFADVAVLPTLAPIRRRISRRTSSLAAIGACALVAAALVAFWRPHTPLSANDLIAQSGDWAAQLWDRATWMANGSAKYPFSSAVRAQALAWTDVSSIVGEDAIAYDISIGGHRAALFVIPSSDFVANPAPPAQPQSSTGGQMIGCWQTGGMVYVLVVEGDARAYQNLIRPSVQRPFA
jgi:hypothetical protein